MTYLDKYKEEHPNDTVESDGLPRMCPVGYGYEKTCHCSTDHGCPCEECWNREIPGTEPTDKTENNERKENTMNESTPTPILATRKTKAELLKDIADLEKQVEHLDQYKQLEEAADMTAAMCKAYENAGFSREEAFELTKTMIVLSAKTGRR